MKAFFVSALLAGITAFGTGQPKPILFVADSNYPPVTYQEGGVAKGLWVDLASAVGQSLGVPWSVTVDDWAKAQADLREGRVDVLYSMSFTPERNLLYDLSRPVAENRFTFFTRGRPGIETLGDLGGLTVGVTGGGLPRQLISPLKTVTLAPVQTYEEGFSALEAGTIAVFAADRWVGVYILSQGKWPDITPASSNFARLDSGFAVRKGNRALLDRINGALVSLKANGTLAAIFAKWEPKTVVFLTRETLLAWTTVGLVSLLAVLTFWTCLLLFEIRKRKKAEKVISTTAIRYKTLLETASDGIHILDRKGRVLEANARFCSMLGYTAEELKNMKVGDWDVRWEDRELEERIVQLIEKPDVFETVHRRKDGSQIEVEISASGLDLDDQQVLFAASRDISDRIRTLETLKKTNERLTEVLDSSLEATYKKDLVTDSYVYISPAFGRLSGYPADEIEQMSTPQYLELVHPEDKERILQIIKSAEGRHLKETFSIDYRFRTKAGTYRWFHDQSVVQFGSDGRALSRIGSVGDITERVQAEAARAELEAKNRQFLKIEGLGRMAAAISHLFNNHLQSILSNLEMLGARTGDTAQAVSVYRARLAAEKASEVSRLILTYLGQGTGDRQPGALSVLCRNGLELFRKDQGALVEIELEGPDLGPVVLVNPVEFQTVFANVLTNALEAMEGRPGIVRVLLGTCLSSTIDRRKLWPLGWEPKDQAYAFVEILDRGRGFSDFEGERMFDPFFTTKVLGQGMGLPVALGIIQAHGGGIGVSKADGQGSVFRIFLPLAEVPGPHSAALEEGPRSGAGGQTVLFVDDDEMLLESTAELLELLGYPVLKARDGVEALEVFRAHQPEVGCVITDLSMPRMDGWQTLEALRLLDPSMPVVLASGYDISRDQAGDHREIPDRFLTKPFDVSQLRKVLGTLMGSTR